MEISIKQQKICGYLIGLLSYWGLACPDLGKATLIEDMADVLNKHDDFELTSEELSKLQDLQIMLLEYIRSLS